MRRRRGIMGLNGGAGIPVIAATATGNPLTFKTDMIKPLKSLVIPFTPIQDGSGDPSPDNVRPISGWTGCEIKESGKNLLDQSLSLSRSIINSSSKKITANAGYKVFYFKLKPNTNYIVSHAHGSALMFGLTKVMPATNVQCYGYVVLTNYYNYAFNSGDYKYVCLSCANGTVQVQLEFGQTATSYQAFKGKTIPITFTDPTTGDPMTVYDGTLTLNEDGSVDLVSDMGLDTKSSSDIALRILNSGSSGYNVYRLRMPVEYGNVLISNQYKQYPSVNDATAAGGGIAIGNKTGSNLYISVVFPWVSGDTNETADARLLANTLQIGYTLATPQTYHFDNVGQLITFVDTNNIWTDTNGTNTATYLKHQS